MKTGHQTIKRSQKSKNNPYKPMRRATFEDRRLSFEARGVLAYLLVKPDNWEIQISDLMEQGEIGRDKAYKIIKELVDCGYCERKEVREKGRFVGYEYLINEEPIRCEENAKAAENTDTPFTEKPDTVSPDTVSPDTENQDRNNKEELQNKNSLNKEEEEGDAREDRPTTPIESPAPPPLPATNAFGTKLDDARMCYDDPPTGPKTPPPVPEKPRPRKRERVTSPHLDPRKFKNGFVVAGEGATAVEVYYERFAIGDDKARLSAPLEDDLIAHCPDLDRLRSVIEAYSRTAYKPRNMQLIFDWYAKGITQNGQEKKAYDHRKQPTTRPEPAHARPDLYEQFGWNATAAAPA